MTTSDNPQPIVMVTRGTEHEAVTVQVQRVLEGDGAFVLEPVEYGSVEFYNTLGAGPASTVDPGALPVFFCQGQAIGTTSRDIASFLARRRAVLAKGGPSGELLIREAGMFMDRYAGRLPDGCVRALYDYEDCVRTATDRKGEVVPCESVPVAVPVHIDDLEHVRLEIVYKWNDVLKASDYPQLEPDEEGNLIKVVIGDVAAFIRNLARMQSMARHMNATGCTVSSVGDTAPTDIWVETFDENFRCGLAPLRVYANDAHICLEGKCDPSDSYDVTLPTIRKIKELARKQLEKEGK